MSVKSRRKKLMEEEESQRLRVPRDASHPSSTAQLLNDANLQALAALDSPEQIKYFLDERIHLISQVDTLRSQFDKQYSTLKRRLEESESVNERLTNEHRLSSKELLLYKNLVDPSGEDKDYREIRSMIERVLQENERLNEELQNFKTTDPVYEQVQLLERANHQLKQEVQRTKTSLNPEELKELKVRLSQSLAECDRLRTENIQLHQQQQTSSPKQIRPSSTDVVQLRDHVQQLEQTLHKRDYELQKLQNEIEKGTSSIMSSIEDLYLVSTNVSSPSYSRPPATVDDLQNELDELHDKLDELTRENQVLKTRTQEFDTIYEENEFLYAEKSQWNEEIERARVRQLVLEQEIRALKEREKEFFHSHDTSLNTSSTSKRKNEVLKQSNARLEGELLRLQQQLETSNDKYQQVRQELNDKTEHFKKILDAARNSQQVPQELIRIEKLNVQMQNELEEQKEEYEKIITALEDQSDKREQKYGSLYDTIVKLQSDFRQREQDFLQQMEEIVKQRDQLQKQYEAMQQDNQAMKEEIQSNSSINRDLKSALTSTNNDSQQIHRQWKVTLKELQEKYEHELDKLRAENKQIITNYDTELLKTRQLIIQLQHENSQYSHQLDKYRSNVGKLQVEIGEKRNFIEQVQNDLSERSTLHVSINKQLLEENQVKAAKLIELEEALLQDQQRRTELQRTVQDLQLDLLKSRTIVQESVEKSEEFERRLHDTDKHCHQLNDSTEPTRRELLTLRSELVTRADQVTILQHALEDERLKRQRLEMKLKRLKDEYINVRKELYHRVEENNTLQHELVGVRMKNDYYSQMSNQTFDSARSSTDNEPNTAVQLYLKEKAENQHGQLKCRTYQQKVEQLQKSYELLKEKYKERIQEEREVFERAKRKYLDHIKNVQRDLHETRQLLEKDAELKINQEGAYQQLIDERRNLLTSMVDKDAKVREMRRENLLLLSKIQLLENQMEGLNDRVDRTLRERNQLRREINTVRFDTNVSIETSARTSPMARSLVPLDTSGWTTPVYHTESFGFINGQPHAELT